MLVGLLVKSNENNVCLRREVSIIAPIKSYFGLIKMDKDVYKPGDKVQFQVLVLDHEAKPLEISSIKVKVINNNDTVTNKFETTESSKFGIYEDIFTLLDGSSLGKWRIEVAIDGSQFISSKSFLVKDLSWPQLFIETAPRVAFKVLTPVIDLKISANVNITGKVKIITKIYYVDHPEDIKITKTTEKTITEGNMVVSFNVKKDLGVKILHESAIAEFDVELTQNNSDIKSKQSTTVELVPMGRYNLKIYKKASFIPGFSYKIQAFVYDINGELEPTTSIPLTMKVNYNYKNKRQSNATETEVLFLKNGTATFTLHPEKDAMDFHLNLEFDDCLYRETIKSQKHINEDTEFMQVLYEPQRYATHNLILRWDVVIQLVLLNFC